MPTDMLIRDATAHDGDGITAVSRAHGFTDLDSAIHHGYREFVASHGRMVVAVEGNDVVGFGGAIDVDDARLVTDLFLVAAHQGRGLGGAMVRALVADVPRRMTFSSLHERAQPTYARAGMQPRWQLHYWSGRTAPDSTTVASTDVVDVAAAEWQGDRPDLVERLSRRGARLLHVNDAGRLAGWAILAPIDESSSTWAITRLSTDLPHDVVVRDVIARLPPGVRVLVCTPDRSTAGPELARMGFEHVDTDVFCATDGLDLPSRLAVVHPGLG